jgi:membrane protein DedA with SNARE-associated domain
MLESILNFLQNVPEIYVIGIVFAFSLAENLFPPSPSDSIIMFGGTLIAIGNAHFHWLLIALLLVF